MTTAGGDLLRLLERIALALEERNVLAKRQTMKAESGQKSRDYLGLGQGIKEQTSDQTAREVRRPKQGSRS